MFLADSSAAFLTPPPGWTLSGASMTRPDGAIQEVEQSAFHWAHGVWEALAVCRDEVGVPARVMIRIAPDTLRRWKAVGIDPVVEASAQLTEHLRRTPSDGEVTLLTLL